MIKNIGLIVAVLTLSNCSTKNYDPTTSAIGQFFKALGSGDTSEIKKQKKQDPSEVDKEWEEVSEDDSQ